MGRTAIGRAGSFVSAWVVPEDKGSYDDSDCCRRNRAFEAPVKPILSNEIDGRGLAANHNDSLKLHTQFGEDRAKTLFFAVVSNLEKIYFGGPSTTRHGTNASVDPSTTPNHEGRNQPAVAAWIRTK